jgi:hypothetical protein
VKITEARAHRAGHRALLAGIALAWAAFGAAEAVARDLVHLRTGRTIEGTIESETPRVVVLRVANGSVRIPREQVSRIERDQELPEWEIELRRKMAKELRERERKRAEQRKSASSAEEEDASKKAEARLKALVEELASGDPDARRRAAALLEREGEAAVPVLSGALFHSSTFARERAASILGKLNARAAVRTMLVALRSAVPEIKKVRPWQRAFVRVMNASLEKITGRNHRVSLRTAAQGKVVDKYLEWWDGPPAAKPEDVPKGACVTWDTPQIGEKEIAEDDPEREKKLWQARRVGKERRTYTPPKSFTDPFGQR